jgi:tRNA G18 (ribose-2'-O)-methylase SpoU
MARFYGLNVAKTLCKSTTRNIKKVYLLDSKGIDLHKKYSFLRDKVDTRDIIALNEPSFRKMLRDFDLTEENAQGIVMECSDIPVNHSISLFGRENYGNILVLDCVTDIGNIGAITRNCAAFNTNGVLYSSNGMPNNLANNAAIVRSSSGYSDMLDFVEVSNLVTALTELKKLGYWIVGTDSESNDTTSLQKSKKTCDFITTIQMSQSVESLNASVATGIILHYLS